MFEHRFPVALIFSSRKYVSRTSMRRFSLAILVAGCAVIQTGCVTKYPAAEGESLVTFPLPVCTQEKLDLATTQTHDAIESRAATGTICVSKRLDESAPATETGAQMTARLAAQPLTQAERAIREALEPPFMKGGGRKSFGIALSGGGTKSSSFSIGVMAGLADHDLLDRADYISTVSGGGYAAYFYYAHHLFPLLRQDGRPVINTTDLFRDCVDRPSPLLATLDVINMVGTVNHCDRPGLVSRSSVETQKKEDIRYQAFLRCTQDILRPGECDINTTGGVGTGLSKISVLGSISLFPFSNIANTLFDWGYSTSPAGRTYHDGIGLSNGSTLADAAGAVPAEQPGGMTYCGSGAGARAGSKVFDCIPNVFDPDPRALTFDELRTGLLKLNARPAGRIPFWIINAAAPQYRSAFGWLAKSRKDTSNSDMFEMTAVSHGSGRYGYVSAPVSIYDMTVLDAVAASAAFLDANQLVYQNRVVKTAVGLSFHVFNLDWGYDIPNYNVSTTRRRIHRALPVPFYYADGLIANMAASGSGNAELHDRTRSVYIRLIDGGNAENLGVYALIKRNTRTILISDAAQDSKGLFGDICGLKTRLSNSPADSPFPRYLYVPGLADFDQHCDDPGKGEGYDLHRWSAAHPILLGCVRTLASTGLAQDACKDLDESETRLFIMKPAIDLPSFIARQLTNDVADRRVSGCYLRGSKLASDTTMLNCDSAAFIVEQKKEKHGTCPVFPQHSTALMTANSSATLFVAYRELARQYVAQQADLMIRVIDGTENAGANFGARAKEQASHALPRKQSDCDAM